MQRKVAVSNPLFIFADLSETVYHNMDSKFTPDNERPG